MKQNISIFQVDSFTTEPFRGNPAAVCILESKKDDKWMQNIAMEMNLSETAFLLKKQNAYRIRFFSPEAEVPLCGHATLASAHILYSVGIIDKSDKIVFESNAGTLTCRKDGDWITMNFPEYGLSQIEKTTEFNILTGANPVELYTTGHGWTLALLEGEEELRLLKPDFEGMKNSKYGDVIITSPSSDSEYDFCVRCFAPALGINEDPVTGSAHCALTPFWSKRTGKKVMLSHQVSKREGVLKVELTDNKRVEVSGRALTIFKAELYV